MSSDNESGNDEEVVTIAELRSRRGIFKGQVTRFQIYLDNSSTLEISNIE